MKGLVKAGKSVLCWKLTPLVRSVCVPFINRHMGRVYDVTHCYNLGKKKGAQSLPSSILIMCLVSV